ncbi:MAG TPA: methylated-DNA--[protein]-cysteine S-methyltransferase [Acidimicrobiales bacterium]|nr:methylated-DNA--[protein]-cysteine S-methyltransferase [Acidimicrobiales bacterium]
MADTLRYRLVDSPLGTLLLVSDGRALVGLYVADHEKARPVEPAWLKAGEGDDAVLDVAARELREYFAGDREAFDVPVRFEGTEFQASVWRALRDIPFGETISYGELARRIGRPRAVRAVGLANGRNPVSVIVPCHRVIGADGSLTGYGWGTDRKLWLLEHERRRAPAFCGSPSS